MSDSMAARMSRLRLELVNAMESQDYATALLKFDAMRVIYDTTPDNEKDGLRMTWRSVESLGKRLEKLADKASSNGKLYRVPITTGRVGAECE
jgi:hypothetical protein